MDFGKLETFFAEDCSVKDFAELMHGVMTDYVMMAAHAGGEADLRTVARNIDFLDSVRRVVMECGTAEAG